MSSGLFVTEKLLRPFLTETGRRGVSCAGNMPENDLSVAQKLARRYIKHQKLKDALLQYGIPEPTPEMSFMQSFRGMSSDCRKKTVPNLKRRSRSLERPRKGSSLRPSCDVEQQRRGEQNPLKTAWKECDSVRHHGLSSGKAIYKPSVPEVSSAREEVNQMRRAIKCYTDRLIELKAANDGVVEQPLPSSTNERCLNAQVSRQLYSLTQQLDKSANNFGSLANKLPVALPSVKAGLSLQQLNSIHKSAIRCLSSFVNQHDLIAQEEEKQQRETVGTRRSPSPLPPPLPSAVLYSQLCSLLEKLSVCYDAHSSVHDPDFIESIRRLKPKSAPSRKKSPSPVLKKRSDSSTASQGSHGSNSHSNTGRIRSQRNEESAQFTRVEDISTKDSSPRRCDGTTQTSAAKKATTKSSRKVERNRKSNSPLLQRLLVNTSGQSQQSPRSPQNRSSSYCGTNSETVDSIRARLTRMEMEAATIRQKWLSCGTSTSRFQQDRRLFVPEIIQTTTDSIKISDQPEIVKPAPKPSSNVVTNMDESYFNKIVNIVQNRIFDEIIEESLSAEFDRFEAIADQLVEHLLQTELLICS